MQASILARGARRGAAVSLRVGWLAAPGRLLPPAACRRPPTRCTPAIPLPHSLRAASVAAPSRCFRSSANPPEPLEGDELGWAHDADVEARGPQRASQSPTGSVPPGKDPSMLGATPPQANLGVEAEHGSNVHGVSPSSTPMGHEPEQAGPPFDWLPPRRAARTRLERSYDEDTDGEDVLAEAAQADSPRQRRLMAEELADEQVAEEVAHSGLTRPRPDGFEANVDEKESSHQRMPNSGLDDGPDLTRRMQAPLRDAAARTGEALEAAMRSTKQQVQQLAQAMSLMRDRLKQQDKQRKGVKESRSIRPQDDPATMM